MDKGNGGAVPLSVTYKSPLNKGSIMGLHGKYWQDIKRSSCRGDGHSA